MLLQPARREGRRFLNPVPTKAGSPSLIFKVMPRMVLEAKSRAPHHPLGPFRTDPSIYAVPPLSGLRITWVGHSTSLVEIDGQRILLDPLWDERAAPTSWAGPKRFFRAPLDLAELPPLDAIIVSHDHYDHLGAETVRALVQFPAAAGATWITSLGVGGILRELGVGAAQCRELNWMDSADIGGAGMLRVTSLPARHFSGRSLFNRFETLWASFVIAGPHHRLYFGADSGEWPGYSEIGKQFGPFDLTMLEIGASDPLWSDIHMGPDGAVRSFRAMGGQGLLMPIHWGLFDLGLHTWKQPIEEIWHVDGLKLWSPTPGEPSEVAGVELRSEWWRQS